MHLSARLVRVCENRRAQQIPSCVSKRSLQTQTLVYIQSRIFKSVPKNNRFDVGTSAYTFRLFDCCLISVCKVFKSTLEVHSRKQGNVGARLIPAEFEKSRTKSTHILKYTLYTYIMYKNVIFYNMTVQKHEFINIALF